MKRYRKVLIGLAFVALGTFAFFKLNYPSSTFRYKLTAEVMTPEGLKTGSSVIEVSYSSVHPLPNPGRWSSDSVTGEAVYVDLGGGKNLFVLLTNSESGRTERDRDYYGGGRTNDDAGALRTITLPLKIFNLEARLGEERIMARQVWEYLVLPGKIVEPNNLPTLTTFRDINDPESVEIVQPQNLAASFGQGYELRLASLQITDEPVSEGIESLLRWLPEKKTEWEKSISISIDDLLITRLNYNAFKQPIK
ncbi:MAG: hypothetical protein Q8L53_01125 [Aestuariivirga sp.]|nr:hypothetical protein [Aestuariivirga sp.]